MNAKLTRLLIVTLGFLSASACMMSPRDGQHYGDLFQEDVLFFGVSPVENGVVQFQAASFNASGSIVGWDIVTGCTAADLLWVDAAGDEFFYCQVEAPLLYTDNVTTVGAPSGQVRAEVRARLRAPDSTRWVNAYTYDEDALSCIAWQETADEIVNNCARDERTVTIYGLE